VCPADGFLYPPPDLGHGYLKHLYDLGARVGGMRRAGVEGWECGGDCARSVVAMAEPAFSMCDFKFLSR